MLDFDSFYDLMAEEELKAFLYPENEPSFNQEDFLDIEIFVRNSEKVIEKHFKDTFLAEKRDKALKKERKNLETYEKLASFPSYIERSLTSSGVKLSVDFNELAIKMFKKHEFRSIISKSEIRLFGYDVDNGVYREMFFDHIKKAIQREIIPYQVKAQQEEGIKSFVTTDVLNKLAEYTRGYEKIKEIKIDTFDKDEYHIVFNNGVYNVKTQQMSAYSPDLLAKRKVDCNYNPIQTPTPVFDMFLEHLCTTVKYEVDEETGTQYEIKEVNHDKITVVLEVMGTIISNIYGYKFKQFPVLVGKGDTGKSKVIELLYEIVGEDFGTATTLTALEGEKNATYSLLGKRFAFDSDISFNTVKENRVFKALTGGDPIVAEQKYSDPITFTFRGVYISAANDMPKFSGDKGAHVYRRWLPLEFNNVVPVEKRDANIVSKMLLEAEGIVTKCLKAVTDMLKRSESIGEGKQYAYTKIKEVEQMRLEMQLNNSTSLSFLHEFCMPRKGKSDCLERISKEQLYQVYHHYMLNIKKNRYIDSLEQFETQISMFTGIDKTLLKNRKYGSIALNVKEFRAYPVKFNHNAYNELNVIKILKNLGDLSISDNEAEKLHKIAKEFVRIEENQELELNPDDLKEVNKLFEMAIEGASNA